MQKRWLMLVVILLVTLVFAITIVPPTPSGDAYVRNTSLKLNFSIHESSLSSLTYNWNGTNHSLFNSSVVLFLNFDNTTALGDNATHVTDHSSSSNNGTLVNQAFINSSGRYGSGVQFDGLGDYIEIRDSIFDGATQFTLLFWVKLNELNQDHILMTKGDFNVDEPIVLWRDEQTSGTCAAATDAVSVLLANGVGGTIRACTPAGTLNDTNWHQVGLTFDANIAGGIQFYIDGLPSGSAVDSIGIASIEDNANPIRVGTTTSFAAFRDLNGSLDELQMWDKALSAEAIAQLYMTNLRRYNTTTWELNINQTSGPSSTLNDDTYSYFLESFNAGGVHDRLATQYVTIDTVNPLISYGTSTPTDGLVSSTSYFAFNTSITELNPDTITYGWNSTNYTMYNDSLVLMYNFDNISSIGEDNNTVIDASYYNRNGTVEGGTSFNQSGKYHGAAVFNGADSGITFPGVNFTNEFTISFWWNVTHNAAFGPAISRNSGGAENKLAINSDATNFFIRVLNGGSSDTSVTLPTENQWHLITLTRDSSDVVTLYVDAQSPTTLFSGAAQSGSSYWSVLGRSHVSSGQYIDGNLDEIRMWNRTLSTVEIYESYASNLRKYDVDKWELYVNQSSNATTTLTDNNYTYAVSITDRAGVFNSTATRTYSVDTTLPLISVFEGNPAIGTVGYGAISSNITPRILFQSLDVNLDSCFYSNDTMTTNYSLSDCSTISGVTWSEGNHTVNIYSNDTAGNQANVSFYFTIDTILPLWSSNKTDITNESSGNVYFNLTMNDINPDTYIFSFYSSGSWTNDTPQSYNDGEEISVTKSVSSGTYNWTWYINDSAGNLNQTDIWGIVIPVTSSTPSPSSTTDTTISSSSRSGGGGGSFVISKNVEQFSVNVRAGTSYPIIVNNQPHRLEIIEVYEDRARAIIASKEVDLTLLLNEEQFVDVDGDEVYDFSLTLQRVYGNNVKLLIKSVEPELEIVDVEILRENKTEPITEKEEEKKTIFEITGDEASSNVIYIVIIAILLIFLLFPRRTLRNRFKPENLSKTAKRNKEIWDSTK